MSIFRNHFPLMGAAGQSTGYEIDQSIRFDEGSNAYLSRTPSSAGNRRNWTFSAWIKFSMKSTNGYHNIFAVRQDSNDFFEMAREVNNSGNYRLAINNQVSGTNSFYFVTNRQFRDPAAWYHLVFVADTTHASTDERFRLYINGDREKVFDTYTMPTQNYDTHVNTTNVTAIGTYPTSSGYDMDGYMAEIHLLDGYSYGPEFFGESDDYGNWIPKEYTGSHGTNGAYITGSDSSNLGKNEASANTYAAFASTNLATHDQVLDTPTNNFAVINPLVRSNNTHSEGNLKIVCTTSTPAKFVSTIGVTSGKWYMEFRHNADNNFVVGITKDNQERDYLGGADDSTSVSFWPGTAAGSGQTSLFVNNSSLSWDGSSTTWSAGDFIGLALNADDSIIAIYKNGSSLGSYDYSALNWTDHFFAGGNYVSSTYIANFGQEGTFAGATTAGGNSDGNGIGNFKYSVPSGYLALCTQNLWESS